MLLIIAHKGFQPIEYGITRQWLEEAGIKVITASDQSGTAIAADNGEVKVDLVLEEVNVNDYDGIFFIGGSGAIEHLDNDRSYRIIHQVDRAHGKIYGAICISTRILAHAGVLEGRRVTGWDGDHKLDGILRDAGAEYVNMDVVVDRTIITAIGPKVAKEFGQAIIETLQNPYLEAEEGI